MVGEEENHLLKIRFAVPQRLELLKEYDSGFKIYRWLLRPEMTLVVETPEGTQYFVSDVRRDHKPAEKFPPSVPQEVQNDVAQFLFHNWRGGEPPEEEDAA